MQQEVYFRPCGTGISAVRPPKSLGQGANADGYAAFCGITVSIGGVPHEPGHVKREMSPEPAREIGCGPGPGRLAPRYGVTCRDSGDFCNDAFLGDCRYDHEPGRATVAAGHSGVTTPTPFRPRQRKW